MAKTVFTLLIGDKARRDTNDYQLLQEKVAVAEGKRLGLGVEVAFAPGFDQLRVLRQRLHDKAAPPVDAVITEPVSVAIMELILSEVAGQRGLLLLNAWGPSVEEHARGWGSRHPFGTVSTDHVAIGEIQGRQISALLPRGGNALCITGPQRSSAAQQRLAGTRSTLRSGITLFETEAGQWTEADGMLAFNSWYGTFKARNDTLGVVAGHNDELAIGAQNAARAVKNPAHRDMLRKARFMGIDACPNYGKRHVDGGELSASITTPANTGMALAHLQAFWQERKPVPLQTFTTATAYPPTSV